MTTIKATSNGKNNEGNRRRGKAIKSEIVMHLRRQNSNSGSMIESNDGDNC